MLSLGTESSMASFSFVGEALISPHGMQANLTINVASFLGRHISFLGSYMTSPKQI